MELKGSQTEKELWNAFAGESQARTKYSLWSEIARREGYEQIGAIFQETADNELQHAKMLFRFLGGLSTTEENLKRASEGEHYEWTDMYKNAYEVAHKEGFTQIATFLKEVAEVEEEHEKRYNKLIQNIQQGLVFDRPEQKQWHCRNCGYVHIGQTAPEVCPACLHPQSFFEIYAQNY